ncbi:glycosyltransferase family 4 protein [Enterovirga aerilata]|uniref:Glycosyltransferase family 4 protein n=1 Tax=Enterovirga aerilata TaxID=2730920 RepID=A0A849HW04_9HYPH|nr:glycosyltransferase family 4 protein [Enterovirga sp. DB1703]NNM71282.1 glycosyltransferase family 4 protein [Enterovirga sp. DB1703]
MPEICLVSKVWRSGTGWYAQLLAEAIAGAGATVAFVSPLASPEAREPSHPNVTRIVVPRELVVPAMRPARVMASLRRSLTSTLRTALLRGSTRVFIFTIPEPLPFTVPLLLFLRATGARIIFVVHDPEPHAWRFAGALRSVERIVHDLIYGLAQRLVVLAPAGARVLEQSFGIQPSRISVVPHGPFAVQGVGPVPGSGRFLCFGTIRRNKNVLEAIRGVKLARARGLDVRLLIAGEPHPLEREYWDECLSEIARDPDGFDVDLRFVRDEDLPGILSGIDAFILAYDNFESQSGVAVMAAVSGRPVIGSRSGGLADLFAAGMAGEEILGPVGPASIADAIDRFAALPAAEWQVRASAAAARVSTSIAWGGIGRTFVDLARSA